MQARNVADVDFLIFVYLSVNITTNVIIITQVYSSFILIVCIFRYYVKDITYKCNQWRIQGGGAEGAADNLKIILMVYESCYKSLKLHFTNFKVSFLFCYLSIAAAVLL